MDPAPQIDPSTPTADVAGFVATIRHYLGQHTSENHGPSGGYEFRWSHKGLWKISAAAILDAEPLIDGPRGYLRLARCDDWHARLALIILDAIDGLPDGVKPPVIVSSPEQPRPATPGRVYSSNEARRPAPRPASRQPGANTGRRPGPGFAGPVDRGPGAAYTPQLAGPGPTPAGPEIAAAGSDLPARDYGLTRIDDTGATVEPPAVWTTTEHDVVPPG